MFASKKPNAVIAEGTKIVGTVTSQGFVEVNGQVKMNTQRLARHLLRCSTLRNAAADNVTVDGKVVGPIQAGEVILRPQAHVVGDIQCQSVIVERGAFMEGRLMRTPSIDGRQPDALLSDLIKAKSVEESLLAKAETSTRKAELIVEDATPSGNPDLPPRRGDRVSRQARHLWRRCPMRQMPTD